MTDNEIGNHAAKSLRQSMDDGWVVRRKVQRLDGYGSDFMESGLRYSLIPMYTKYVERQGSS